MKPGAKSSEFISLLGSSGAAIFAALDDPEPAVRLTALLVVGVLATTYTIGRSLVKRSSAARDA